ncbi:hypothetical protein [Streptomyces adelaidensis]|uniref:hypothetical protein n=1 Tax=Streptomyces adelaidensis TaxID=2796465 RepID=UPI00190714B7|nr:hypothetical protein [Streptomyces adelaidensis]
MQRILARTGITLGGLALAVGSATVMAPTAQSAGTSTIARFEGKTIDLSEDWGAAKACNVQQGVIECFRTAEKSDARAAQQAKTASPSAALGYCSTPLRLYEHANFNLSPFPEGRILSFYDSGYWQNLGDYGFNDQTSSYRTGSCATSFAKDNDGRGTNPSNVFVGAWQSDGRMGGGTWNDLLSSVYLY